MYIYNCIYIYTHIYIYIERERAAYHGGGVVKGLIYKVLHHYAWVGVVMRCYEMVKQNISKHNVILQEMCFHQWFWCLQWILHYIVVYITIYIYTHTIDRFIWFFHDSLCFSIYIYMILNRHASFHAVHECFSQKNLSRLNMHFFKKIV